MKHIIVNSVYQKKHLEMMCLYRNVDINTNNNDRMDVPKRLKIFLINVFEYIFYCSWYATLFYINFKYTTQWSDTYTTHEVIPPISPAHTWYST